MASLQPCSDGLRGKPVFIDRTAEAAVRPEGESEPAASLMRGLQPSAWAACCAAPLPLPVGSKATQRGGLLFLTLYLETISKGQHKGRCTPFSDSSAGKESACNTQETVVRFLGWEDPLEKG